MSRNLINYEFECVTDEDFKLELFIEATNLLVTVLLQRSLKSLDKNHSYEVSKDIYVYLKKSLQRQVREIRDSLQKEAGIVLEVWNITDCKIRKYGDVWVVHVVFGGMYMHKHYVIGGR